jgi:hypothetical protein
MFSCGSLGPKLRRGGGCMDHGFTREKEPWEASDGALYMLREVAAVRPNDVAPFLPQVRVAACLRTAEKLPSARSGDPAVAVGLT